MNQKNVDTSSQAEVNKDRKLLAAVINPFAKEQAEAQERIKAGEGSWLDYLSTFMDKLDPLGIGPAAVTSGGAKGGSALIKVLKDPKAAWKTLKQLFKFRSASKAITKYNPRTLLGRQLRNEMSGSRINRMAKAMKRGTFDWDATGPIRIAERGGKRIIIDGHHRAAAAIRAGLKDVPVTVEKVTDKVWDTLLMQAREAATR